MEQWRLLRGSQWPAAMHDSCATSVRNTARGTTRVVVSVCSSLQDLHEPAKHAVSLSFQQRGRAGAGEGPDLERLQGGWAISSLIYTFPVSPTSQRSA
jgi:hypothetical protein